MFCRKCGKELADNATFCSYCGANINGTAPGYGKGTMLYRLPIHEQRDCEICVYPDKVTFQGNFWYLIDKEFVKSRTNQETARIQDFLGIGYLAKRSYKKCVLFAASGAALELFKLIVDKLTELIDHANTYLQWFNQSISLPTWMNVTLNVLAILCALLGLVLFFSKKKVIEISFTDKRICVPQKSMSASEYQTLYQSITEAKKMK